MYQDLWEYDPGSDTWMQKMDYPAGPRLSSFGFSIGSTGYAGCGLDQNLYAQSTFYAYHPSTNSWTAKAFFIGTPIFGASSCVINNKGYVVCGDDWDPNYWRHNEMYRYDPVADSWNYETTMPADGRRDPVGFAINGKFYVGTGSDNSYIENYDWWEYDPANGVWTQKSNFIGSARSQAVGWSVGGKGYLGTGGVADVNDFWEYDPVSNSWSQVDDFPGQGRENAQSFVIGTKAYLVCGTSGVNYNDIWEFDPLNITGMNEQEDAVDITSWPNPATDVLNVRLPNENGTMIHYQISDISGRITKEDNIRVDGSVMQVPVNDLASGTYILNLVAEGKAHRLEFVK